MNDAGWMWRNHFCLMGSASNSINAIQLQSGFPEPSPSWSCFFFWDLGQIAPASQMMYRSCRWPPYANMAHVQSRAWWARLPSYLVPQILPFGALLGQKNDDLPKCWCNFQLKSWFLEGTGLFVCVLCEPQRWDSKELPSDVLEHGLLDKNPTSFDDFPSNRL